MAIIPLALLVVIIVTYEFLVRRFEVMRILFGMKPKIKQLVVQPGDPLAAR